jgi:peptidylprolyl isomerase
MKNKVFLIIVLCIVVFGIVFTLVRNNNKTQSTDSTLVAMMENQVPAIEEKSNKLSVESEKKYMQATFKTNKGDIEIEFYSATPKTVENFTKLASEGFYDGVKFHRVIKGFMVQGGDPLSKDDSKQAYWGTGGPGYKFNDEIGASNKNDIGTISMANAGPNTNGSQFFINTAANNFLDTKHTVFGKVVKGMDVVTAIENTPTGPNDRPVSPVVIESIVLK